MVAFYGSLERPGAVGPKLIYEDGSLQHAGLFFERPEESGIWTNEHYYKGLHGDLPAANLARRVPAVTGACLMIDSQVYADVGGMSGLYLQGDYEDSDLCLRLLAAGRENWYYPGAVLYHLEAQSYPTASRETNRQYNRSLFNDVWGVTIDKAGPKFASVSAGSGSAAGAHTRLPVRAKSARAQLVTAPSGVKGNGNGRRIAGRVGSSLAGDIRGDIPAR
jgi:GT2 family glycosyltransferase